MGRWQARYLILAGVLACAVPLAAQAAEPIVEETLDVNLDPLIDAAVAKRDRFAVSVPHAVSTDDSGQWTRSGGVSTWRYSVRIPTAVSMSFHADRFELPPSAVLEVGGADGSTAAYSSANGGERGLWSRIQRGSVLQFELRVPTVVESQLEFAIASLQAGYRGLGDGASDHRRFRELQKVQQAATNTCIENFQCHETDANSANGAATAAIVIGGVALCTATLINNLRNDATPYLLTARHCQDTPHSGIVVYWDAVSPCSAAIGSVYDTTTPAYVNNTQTVFEQQDIWMIRLTSPPNGNRVYFAGWDATGETFIGGYSPHHAMGRSRQYAEWFGQAFPITFPGSVLGIGYQSDYWGVVNSVGSVGSGASGGGLFNTEHRLVGVASMAYLENGPGSDGVCPAASPPAPDSITSTALYNSIAAVWESNADTTSSTNPVTLQSLLDPANTGSRVADGFEMLNDVYLTTSERSSDTGRTITLSWNGGSATSCTASDGVPGDGWSGRRDVNGTAEITQYAAGLTTYTIRCTDGVRFAIRSVRVLWNFAPPSLVFAPSDSSGLIGTTVSMFWRGTALPCIASGGVAGDGWAGEKTPTGTLEVPLLQAGDTSYTMTCGTGPRAAVQTMQVRVHPPRAELTPATTTIRVNSELLVMQSAAGASCTRTGGAPGDGWTSIEGSYPLHLKSAVPGTYRYTLTCYGGPHGSPAPAQATMDITFTSDPPAATLTPSQLSAEVSPGSIFIDTPDFVIDFSWLSNVAPCQLTYDGPGDNDGAVHPTMDAPAAGTMKAVQYVPGVYVYTSTCRSGGDVTTASATVEFTPTRSRVFLYRDSTITLARDQGFTLYWSSNIEPCVGSGGSPGDGWAGPKTGRNGQPIISIAQAGTYVYTLTCGADEHALSESVTITIPPAMLEFEPHVAATLTTGSVDLRWNGTVGNCVLTGDWSHPFPLFASGSMPAYSDTPGVRTFGVRCGLTDFIEATTQVTFLPSPTVDITASTASAAVNQPVTLTWTSTDADTCTAQEEVGTPEWSGLLPASGSRVVTRSTPGAVGFYINCGDVLDAVVVEWLPISASPATPSPPTVSFTIDQATRVVGESVTLTWTTTRAAACYAGQGSLRDGWVGALPVSGTRQIKPSMPGTYTWEIACEGAPPAATAIVSATFTAPPNNSSSGGGSGSSGGGGGGGGGGSMDMLLLALLGTSILLQARARERAGSKRSPLEIEWA